MAALEPKPYEALLKKELVCWRCEVSQKNMPTLKEHLQEHFNKISKREKSRADSERKRKPEEEREDVESQSYTKRAKIDAS